MAELMARRVHRGSVGMQESGGSRRSLSRQSASVSDVEADPLFAGAEGERGLLEGRLGHYNAGAAGPRIALDRHAEEGGVQMGGCVLVVRGAERIGARR